MFVLFIFRGPPGTLQELRLDIDDPRLRHILRSIRVDALGLHVGHRSKPAPHDLVDFKSPDHGGSNL